LRAASVFTELVPAAIAKRTGKTEQVLFEWHCQAERRLLRIGVDFRNYWVTLLQRRQCNARTCNLQIWDSRPHHSFDMCNLAVATLKPQFFDPRIAVYKTRCAKFKIVFERKRIGKNGVYIICTARHFGNSCELGHWLPIERRHHLRKKKEQSMSTLKSATMTMSDRHSTLKKCLRASSIGNAIEWFDWTVYAIFAPYLAKNMFNPSDETSALLSTLAVFAVGFIARPLGGLIFGRLADRRGRRHAMVVTVSMMAAGSLIVGCCPGYGQMGVLSSIVLLVARLVQGLAHGGDSANSYVYISEIAPKESRGLWSSAIFVSVTFGSLLATLLGVALTKSLEPSAMLGWGWRIPFILGTGLGIFAYYLRRGLMETEVFVGHRETTGRAMSPGAPAPTGSNEGILKATLRLVIFTAGTTVTYYTWAAFASTYAISVKGMPAEGAFMASMGAQIITIIMLPVWGALSDRIGRKPLALGFACGFIVLAYPLDWLLGKEPWTLFVAQSIALTLWAMVASIYPAIMSEQLPTHQRAVGTGIASSGSVALFGGTAPYINTWLASQHMHGVFTAYVIVLCAATAVAVLTMRESRASDLAGAGVVGSQ
jgi:MHS family alpha-ketoglutarate permease-like MFS transporter